MRWTAVAVVLALSSAGVNAADFAADYPAAEVPAPVVVPESIVTAMATVTVTAIPSHSMTAEMVKELKPNVVARPAKKVKIAQKKRFPKSLLSRTERHQLALMVVRPKPGEAVSFDLLNDEDAGSGEGDLDLQRFFSRPKVARAPAQDDEAEDQEPELSDVVKLRLFLARQQALRAHERKFT